MKTLLLIIAIGLNLQAQDITIVDSINSYNPILIQIEMGDTCSPYFEAGTHDDYHTMYIKGYSDTEEHFYILIDCNGYIIDVYGLKHKTELNK